MKAREKGRSTGLLARLLRLVGLLGVGLAVPPGPVQAGDPGVPEHWISYAQLTGHQFQDWLAEADSEAVVRLHQWMQRRLLEEAGPPPEPLVVAVWVGADGRVRRLEFPTLGDAGIDADLRAVLTSRPLAEPPPPDMRQPMRLQLSLDFAVAT